MINEPRSTTDGGMSKGIKTRMKQKNATKGIRAMSLFGKRWREGIKKEMKIVDKTLNFWQYCETKKITFKFF